MNINSIKVEHFRNFTSTEIDFHPGLNIFLGDNGQGKTNLLEIIYLITKGKSFRPAKGDSFVRWGEQFAYADVQVTENELDYHCRFVSDTKSKKFFVNEKKISASHLSHYFSSVLFSPESLSAIKDGPEQRRELVDEFLINYNKKNAKLLQEYRKIVRSRNSALKSHKSGQIDRMTLEDLLDSFEMRYLEYGTYVTVERLNALRDLSPYLLKAMQFISNLPGNVEIAVDYLISSKSAIAWDQNQVYDSLLARYKELKNAEIDSGLSLVGPHKHDIQFLYGKQDSRYFCSQGQQRALILSFKMSQVAFLRDKNKVAPLLLLDDVLSELDEGKRIKLVEYLKQFETQIFITATDFSSLDQFKERDLNLYFVERGNIDKDQSR